VSYPQLFTDLAYELSASSMAVYVPYRIMRLRWGPPEVTPTTALSR
jgi:hypothetical protein